MLLELLVSLDQADRAEHSINTLKVLPLEPSPLLTHLPPPLLLLVPPVQQLLPPLLLLLVPLVPPLLPPLLPPQQLLLPVLQVLPLALLVSQSEAHRVEHSINNIKGTAAGAVPAAAAPAAGVNSAAGAATGALTQRDPKRAKDGANVSDDADEEETNPAGQRTTIGV